MHEEKIKKLLDELWPEFKQVQMRATNLDYFATSQGFTIDWDLGELNVTKK